MWRQLSFSKIFRYLNVYYVNYGQKIQIKAQLLTDIVYNKRDRATLCYVLRIKLTVFMALTNCFRKDFIDFLRFVFISYDFCSSMT